MNTPAVPARPTRAEVFAMSARAFEASCRRGDWRLAPATLVTSAFAPIDPPLGGRDASTPPAQSAPMDSRRGGETRRAEVRAMTDTAFRAACQRRAWRDPI